MGNDTMIAPTRVSLFAISDKDYKGRYDYFYYIKHNFIRVFLK